MIMIMRTSLNLVYEQEKKQSPIPITEIKQVKKYSPEKIIPLLHQSFSNIPQVRLSQIAVKLAIAQLYVYLLCKKLKRHVHLIGAAHCARVYVSYGALRHGSGL